MKKKINSNEEALLLAIVWPLLDGMMKASNYPLSLPLGLVLFQPQIHLSMASSVPTTKNFPCDPPCLRKFKSATALAQHKCYAPAHTQAGLPVRSVSTNGASGRADNNPSRVNGTGGGTRSEIHGTQGVRITVSEKPVSKDASRNANGTMIKAKTTQTGAKSRCTLCNKPFATDQALADHVRDSPRHRAAAVKWRQ